MPPFAQIVEAFPRDDVELSDDPVSRVDPVKAKTAKSIVNNINAYGAFALLSAATWERSVYHWMGSYWLFLINLTTVDEVSDLTLHARLRDALEAQPEIQSVHVLRAAGVLILFTLPRQSLSRSVVQKTVRRLSVRWVSPQTRDFQRSVIAVGDFLKANQRVVEFGRKERLA